MITKVEKVTVYVSSQQEAKRFWTEEMGFSVTFEREMAPGTVWIEVAPAGADTTLVLYSKAQMENQHPAMVAHPSIMFAADDIDALHTELEQRGVSVDPVQAMPWGKMLTFRDPDGNPYMVRG